MRIKPALPLMLLLKNPSNKYFWIMPATTDSYLLNKLKLYYSYEQDYGFSGLAFSETSTGMKIFFVGTADDQATGWREQKKLDFNGNFLTQWDNLVDFNRKLPQIAYL